MTLDFLFGSSSGYRSVSLVFMVLFIVLQFIAILLLMFVAIFIRVLDNRRARLQAKYNEIWYPLLFSFLDNEIKPEEIEKQILPKHYYFFIEFIKEFFLDLEGDEREHIKEFLKYLKIDELLIKQLSKRNNWKKIYAIYFLGLMHCQSAIIELRKKIFDKSESVRMMAISNLMQLQDLESLSVILKQLGEKGAEENQNRILAFLLEFGPKILPHLEEIYKYTQLKDWVRQVCVEVFGRYVYTNVTEEIVTTFEETDNIELKISCVAALGEFEDPSLVSFFEKALESPHLGIIIKAIGALGKINDDSTFEKLENLTQATNFWIAKRSIEALAKYETRGIDSLRNILANTQSEQTQKLIKETLELN